jgi:Tetratricopeptide repeat
LVALVALLLALVPPCTAAAQDDQATEVRFKSALTKFHAGDYAGALPILRQVADTTDSPNARLYVARSLRELGRLDEAYAEMRRTVRESTERAKTEDRYVGTRDASASELAELEPRVGKLIVVLVGDPASPTVTINDKELPTAALGQPTPVMPGTIHLVATAAGKGSLSRDVEVAGGKVETVTLTLPDAGATEGPTAQASNGGGEDEGVATTGGEIRLAGYGVAGLGVVGMVMFGVGKALADKKYKKVRDACGGVRCTDPAVAGDIDAGKKLDALTTAGLVIGIAGLAGGAAMIVFGGPTENESITALSIGGSPDGIGVRLDGTF